RPSRCSASGGAEAAWRSRCAVNSRNRPTTAEIGLVRAPAAHTSSPSPRPDGDESSCHCQNGRTRMSHTQTAGNYCYVSFTGHASVVQDREKMQDLWCPAYRAWFPRGLDDPELALLRVDVERAEYW